MKLHRVAIVLISTLMFSTANPVLAPFEAKAPAKDATLPFSP